LYEQEAEGHQHAGTTKSEASITSKLVVEPDYEIKRVPLDPRVPHKAVTIFQDMSLEEEIELLSFLDKNIDIFAWKTSELVTSFTKCLMKRSQQPRWRSIGC
jgi:hypothetical protein